MTSAAVPTARLVGNLGRAQLEEAVRSIARGLGRRPASRVGLADIPVPDTAIASAARLAADTLGVTLANHSHRTYAFGALLGARDGLECDSEALYVAAMLHDIALGPGADREEPFERVGARVARDMARLEGWPAERAETVGRAIAMHMDVGAARERSEVALLHLGAAADVIGARLRDLSPSTVAEVVERFPREGFKAFFAAAIRDEAERHPASATARLCRWGQFIWRIERAPFDG